MNLIYNSDIYSSGFGMCDISFTEGTTLQSVVLMSLLSWRKCSVSELDSDSNRYGYWIDTPSNRFGCRLWTLRRSKLTANTVILVKQFIKEALEWMMDEGICSAIEVRATQTSDRIMANVTIIKNTGDTESVTFDDLWKALTPSS